MSIRTFWTIFIKILGLWMVFGSITILPQFCSTLFMLGYSDNGPDTLVMGGILLLTTVLFFIILWLFVVKPSWLIDKLRLSKDFTEEKIEFNISQPSVLRIAVIIIGGLMFIESLPELCRQVFNLLQEKTLFAENPGSGWIIFYSVKTICAYLLMSNSAIVTRFITRKPEQEPTEPIM